ncbi:MAG: hypothetical protein WDM89_17970 [Rhizomicrobium sp.]
MRSLRIGLDTAADLEPIHARHHHVEENDIGNAIFDLGKRFAAVVRADNLEVFRAQLGFEQLDVRKNVIDDQNTRGHDLSNVTRYPMKRVRFPKSL